LAFAVYAYVAAALHIVFFFLWLMNKF